MNKSHSVQDYRHASDRVRLGRVSALNWAETDFTESARSVFDSGIASYQTQVATTDRWPGKVPVVLNIHTEAIEQKRRLAAEIEFDQFETIVEESKYMLDFAEDWDENGARPIANETWIKATSFARQVAVWANRYSKSCIGGLTVSPLHSGSVDLYWSNDFCDLLLNVPPEGWLGTFHGENKSGEIMAGALDLRENYPELVLTWLRKRRS